MSSLDCLSRPTIYSYDARITRSSLPLHNHRHTRQVPDFIGNTRMSALLAPTINGTGATKDARIHSTTHTQAVHLKIVPFDGALDDLAEHHGAVAAGSCQLGAIWGPGEAGQAPALWPGRSDAFDHKVGYRGSKIGKTRTDVLGIWFEEENRLVGVNRSTTEDFAHQIEHSEFTVFHPSLSALSRPCRPRVAPTYA